MKRKTRAAGGAQRLYLTPRQVCVSGLPPIVTRFIQLREFLHLQGGSCSYGICLAQSTSKPTNSMSMDKSRPGRGSFSLCGQVYAVTWAVFVSLARDRRRMYLEKRGAIYNRYGHCLCPHRRTGEPTASQSTQYIHRDRPESWHSQRDELPFTSSQRSRGLTTRVCPSTGHFFPAVEPFQRGGDQRRRADRAFFMTGTAPQLFLTPGSRAGFLQRPLSSFTKGKNNKKSFRCNATLHMSPSAWPHLLGKACM